MKRLLIRVKEYLLKVEVTKNPFDELTADELRELIAKGDICGTE